MPDKLVKFIQKNYIQIIIAIIIIAVIDRMLMRTEFYSQLGGCIPYLMLGREVGYMDCKEFGHVIPTNNPKAKAITLYKCKIGVPANSMKYKIIIDDFDRYSEIYKYQPLGHVVGSRLRFDNGKEYKIVKMGNASNIMTEDDIS